MFNPSFFQRKFNPFSQEFRDAMADLAGVVNQLAGWEQMIAAIASRQSRMADEVFFPAKITGNTISSTAAIWKYSWTEMRPGTTIGATTDFVTLTSGRTGSNDAINVAESGNTSSVAYGFGVAWSGTQWKLTAAPFTNVEFAAIPTNTIVMMRTVRIATTGQSRFEFWAPNPLIGECESGG
jgi:hypothetical protein